MPSHGVTGVGRAALSHGKQSHYIPACGGVLRGSSCWMLHGPLTATRQTPPFMSSLVSSLQSTGPQNHCGVVDYEYSDGSGGLFSGTIPSIDGLVRGAVFQWVWHLTTTIQRARVFADIPFKNPFDRPVRVRPQNERR